MTQTFAYYLKKRGVYPNFIANATKYKHTYGTTPRFYFDWDKTREGRLFWQIVFDNFTDFLKEKYNCKDVN